nr:uncharacterized protein LOC101236602 [Hydra vulgaris]
MGHVAESLDHPDSTKSFLEDIISSYKRLKGLTENQSRTINGLCAEKEDVVQRLRNLVNRRIESQGPDFDEYCINRRGSRQYEHIDPSRIRTRIMKKTLSVDKPQLENKPTIETATSEI